MTESSRLSPEELVARLADMANVAPQHVRALLQAQAQLAAEYARREYAVPGIGVLKQTVRPPLSMLMQFGPKAGQTIEVPARKKLVFRVCKMMKDVSAETPVRMPDVFDPRVFDVAWYPPVMEPDD